MAPGLALCLLDLPSDLLARIGAPLPLAERLRLSLVCRRLREVCAGPSELWRTVDAHIDVPDYDTEPEDAAHELELKLAVCSAARAKVDAFRRWLTPRAVAVADLSVMLQVHNQEAADGLALQLPSQLLPLQFEVPCMPALRRLTVQFRGRAVLSFFLCPELPALRTLWLANVQLSRTSWDPRFFGQFSCFSNCQGLEFAVYHGQLTSAFDEHLGEAWLPPCTTKLRLLNVGLREVPAVVAHLPRLRSLELDANGPLDGPSLTRLSALSTLRQRLQQLDLGNNALPRFPTEVSVLTNLRVLFLYGNFASAPAVTWVDWEALRPLTKLVFLSISSNGMRELPPAVAAMSHLRGLHIENNPFSSQRLDPQPCLSNLLELLVDWKDALSSPDALRACTRLTRLTLHNHAVWGATAAGNVALPPAFGERLLDALEAMPSLKLVEDVVDQHHLDMLAPAVARCMWEAGRRCPHVRLELLNSTYIGWSLGNMPPEVEAEVAASEAAAAEGDAGGPAAASLLCVRMMSVVCSARSVAVRASSSTSTATAQPRSLVIDISKRKLVDSYGGRAVRNVDNQIYEIVYEAATDSVRVLNKAARVEYATTVNKDNRIAILLDQTTELPGGLPSFPQLQSLLKASSPGAEALNGRLAMLAFVGVVATELATGRSLPAQLATTSGAAHAAALGVAVMAASLAPVLTGRVRPEQAFPSENDSYASTQLPYFWTALAEIINGRVAMIGLAGLLVNELVRGAPLF